MFNKFKTLGGKNKLIFEPKIPVVKDIHVEEVKEEKVEEVVKKKKNIVKKKVKVDEIFEVIEDKQEVVKAPLVERDHDVFLIHLSKDVASLDISKIKVLGYSKVRVVEITPESLVDCGSVETFFTQV